MFRRLFVSGVLLAALWATLGLLLPAQSPAPAATDACAQALDRQGFDPADGRWSTPVPATVLVPTWASPSAHVVFRAAGAPSAGSGRSVCHPPHASVSAANSHLQHIPLLI